MRIQEIHGNQKDYYLVICTAGIDKREIDSRTVCMLIDLKLLKYR